MEVKNKTLMIKVDKVTTGDAIKVTDLAVKHGVPRHASVSIRTDATGTHIVFEWADSITIPRIDFTPEGYKPSWYEEKPYYQKKPKPYKQF